MQIIEDYKKNKELNFWNDSIIKNSLTLERKTGISKANHVFLFVEKTRSPSNKNLQL